MCQFLFNRLAFIGVFINNWDVSLLVKIQAKVKLYSPYLIEYFMEWVITKNINDV